MDMVDTNVIGGVLGRGAYGMSEEKALSWHILMEPSVKDEDDMITMTRTVTTATQKRLINPLAPELFFFNFSTPCI